MLKIQFIRIFYSRHKNKINKGLAYILHWCHFSSSRIIFGRSTFDFSTFKRIGPSLNIPGMSGRISLAARAHFWNLGSSKRYSYVIAVISIIIGVKRERQIRSIRVGRRNWINLKRLISSFLLSEILRIDVKALRN